MTGLNLVYVGTVKGILDVNSGDRFLWFFCESFEVAGYVTELRKLLSKYYENSVFALDGLNGVFVI